MKRSMLLIALSLSLVLCFAACETPTEDPVDTTEEITTTEEVTTTTEEVTTTTEAVEDIDMLVGDVSFISLTKVLPPCGPFLKQGAWIMVLVKPQFECERHEVGSGGVVRDEAVRQRCVDKIVAFCRDELGWNPVGVVPLPILGPKGNQEFIAVFRKG